MTEKRRSTTPNEIVIDITFPKCVVSIKLDIGTKKILDDLARDGGYTNRSELIREILELNINLIHSLKKYYGSKKWRQYFQELLKAVTEAFNGAGEHADPYQLLITLLKNRGSGAGVPEPGQRGRAQDLPAKE